MHGQVVHPDNQNRKIDRQDPEHEDEDGVGVVVEIIVRAGPLGIRVRWTCIQGLTEGLGEMGEGVKGDGAYSFFGNPQRPRAGCYLYNASDHVCELVRN